MKEKKELRKKKKSRREGKRNKRGKKEGVRDGGMAGNVLGMVEKFSCSFVSVSRSGNIFWAEERKLKSNANCNSFLFV